MCVHKKNSEVQNSQNMQHITTETINPYKILKGIVACEITVYKEVKMECYVRDTCMSSTNFSPKRCRQPENVLTNLHLSH
jgi:hypothetical protein